MIKIDDILKKFEEFPTLPTIYMALSEVIENPNSTTNDAAEIIVNDQASSSKVIKFANSSVFGIQKRVETVSEAISFIGLQECRNLILSLSIMKLFVKKSKEEIFNPVDLWKHSVAVGIISRHIGKESGEKKLENYFLAGILHDIGKLFLYKYFKEDFLKTLKLAIDNKLTMNEAEKKALGLSHNVVGEMIAIKWKLPQSLSNSVRYHGTGLISGKFDKLVASVHIANITAHLFELGLAGSWGSVPKPNSEIWNYLNISNDFFSTNLPVFRREYSETMTLLFN